MRWETRPLNDGRPNNRGGSLAALLLLLELLLVEDDVVATARECSVQGRRCEPRHDATAILNGIQHCTLGVCMKEETSKGSVCKQLRWGATLRKTTWRCVLFRGGCSLGRPNVGAHRRH